MDKLFFSYKNWELLYGIAPFTLEPDKVKMREKCDGKEVSYNAESDTFSLATPWGTQSFRGIFCLKKEGEADHTVEEIVKSPELIKEMARLVKLDYMEMPSAFQILAYIQEENGRRGFALVSTGKQEDEMLSYYSLRSPVSFVSEEVREKMESGLLDKYFSCFPVGVLEKGEMANAMVYLTSVDRLSLCMKELTGKDNIKQMDYEKLERFFMHYNETSPEVEEEYKWYNSLITEIMRTYNESWGRS